MTTAPPVGAPPRLVPARVRDLARLRRCDRAHGPGDHPLGALLLTVARAPADTISSWTDRARSPRTALVRRVALAAAGLRADRPDDRLGARALRFPGQAAPRRDRRPAVRAAHGGRRHRAHRALRAERLDRPLLEPLGIEVAFTPLRDRHRADLHRAAVRRAHGAAGASRTSIRRSRRPRPASARPRCRRSGA